MATPNTTSVKLSQVQIADAWAKITVKVWREKLGKLKIGNTNQLYESFIKNVISGANGDVIKIEFAFKYYGKFVDMGVGKGVKIGDVKEHSISRRLEGKMTGNRRKPKKWYSKVFTHETNRLAEILTENYANKAVLVISENLNDRAINH